MLLAFETGVSQMQILSKTKKICSRFQPLLKLGEGWVRSLSRYFKHGLGPNLRNAFDWRAARQAGNMPNLSRPFLEGPHLYRVNL